MHFEANNTILPLLDDLSKRNSMTSTFQLEELKTPNLVDP